MEVRSCTSASGARERALTPTASVVTAEVAMEFMCDTESCLSSLYGVPLFIWMVIVATPICWAIARMSKEKP